MAKSKKKNSLCLVKSSEVVRKAIIKKIIERGLSNNAIILDAKTHNFIIDKAALSRYLSKPGAVSGGLTQEAIVWLAVRYGIGITLFPFDVEKVEIEGKKYYTKKASMNEEDCIVKIKAIWG
jgi:hypothetical protein